MNGIYQIVTDRIIAEMENGEIPWEKPWVGGEGAISHITGKPYSFLNQMLLGCAGEWITFKQCTSEGGKVKKGAKGRPCVFWSQVQYKEDKDGDVEVNFRPLLRYYTVFHIRDCEGITAKYTAETFAHNPVQEAEDIVNGYDSREHGLTIDRYGISGEAWYSPLMDKVQVPSLAQYKRPEEYYSTLFHEITHSTGHETRLNRHHTGAYAAFGSEVYSREELVAEMGAAMLNARCGIETYHSFRNSTAYLQNWLGALKGDPTMVVTAAGKAEKAVKYILAEKDCTPEPMK